MAKNPLLKDVDHQTLRAAVFAAEFAERRREILDREMDRAEPWPLSEICETAYSSALSALQDFDLAHLENSKA